MILQALNLHLQGSFQPYLMTEVDISSRLAGPQGQPFRHLPRMSLWEFGIPVVIKHIASCRDLKGAGSVVTAFAMQHELWKKNTISSHTS
jgi:hypothetical protein